jgi:hypothetical protein
MAIVRFDGQRVRCTIVKQDKDGNWLCVSRQHAPRLSIGTQFSVTEGDIIEKNPAIEQPGELVDASPAKLEADMAAEREKLPSPQQVIKDNPPVAHDAPGKVEKK